jgi:hypothetical protein
MTIYVRCRCLAIFFAVLATCCFGQRSTGTIAGSVQDPSGAGLPDAAITIQNTATGLERSTVSNNEGFYTVTALPAGPYSVTVKKVGFQVLSVPSIVLQVDQQATVNAVMQLGTLSETVSVTGTASPVDVRSATLNTVITQKMTTDLPLNGRNVMHLLRVPIPRWPTYCRIPMLSRSLVFRRTTMEPSSPAAAAVWSTLSRDPGATHCTAALSSIFAMVK